MKDLGGGAYLCPGCDQTVGAESLSSDASKPSGYGAYCTDCTLIRVSAYRKTRKGKATRKLWLKTEKGRLSLGRNSQKQYADGSAGRFFAKVFD